ncbi:hypothetical protein ACIQGZ_16890 [Streptomyces sp. NPDC092296]|uniref:hypothetical protein n=1 Tax=Streptomyces sp. NPDC092296 TaxID=3366012 RepID=UPI0037F70B9D
MCDGCYCGEDDDYTADDRRREEEHQEHYVHAADCYSCEVECRETAGYTRCKDCSLPFPEGRFSMLRHGFTWGCFPLPVIAADEFDWPELYGKSVRFKGAAGGPRGTGGFRWVTGTVVGPWDNGSMRGYPRSLWPMLELERTDEGYGGRTPIAPREWLAIEVLGDGQR